MSNPKKCPNCKVSLEGGLIYDTFIEQGEDEATALRYAGMYGATKTTGRWGRAIGLYDMYEDRTTGWQCPDCNHKWDR